MRAISLTSPELGAFSWLAGQDVALAFTAGDGTTVRRRYSIRRFSAQQRRLEINVVMHGDGPGMRWAQTAAPGIAIDAIGPRGKITLRQSAAWHLFAGDATAVPAAFAMIESLPADVPVLGFFLVDDAAEQQAMAGRTIQWTHGGKGLRSLVGNAAGPPGQGHAYLAGEVALVSSLKAALAARGWSGEQISAKAYWNQGRANAGHGEPEQKVT
jgi:NADPH-dependent ferric siderophore reductase